ncbi:hypothetical protein GCM10008915_71380 [Bifidobacterium pullorum subsp. gallinarum]
MSFMIRIALKLLLAFIFMLAGIYALLALFSVFIAPNLTEGSVEMFVLVSGGFLFMLVLLFFGWYIGRPFYYMIVWVRYLAKGIYEAPVHWQTIHSEKKTGKLKGPYALYHELFDHLMTLTSTLKQIEQDKRDAEQVKREWISGISHDLKTPLTYISGYSSMLMNEGYPWSEEERKEFLSIIHQKADHLRELVQDLNETIDDQIPIQREDLDLIELVRRIAADVISAPGATNYFLTIDSKPERLRLKCDSKLLTRALRNLLVNAIAHNPAGTEITIRITQNESQVVELSVEDNGVGFSFNEANQKHFDQDSPSSGRSGLGLSIARQFIQSLGGELTIRSQKNQGTSITIQLPTETI